MSTRYFAGMGCRRGCSEDVLHELLQQSLREHGIAVEHIVAIASIDSKNDEAGLRALADRLRLQEPNVSLLFFSAEQLQQYADRISAPSSAALNSVGTNVAEASALAAANFMGMPDGQRAELIIRKCKNADATFALAAIAETNSLDEKS